ncbi:MAG: hypothetical protein ACK5PC_08000 [Cyclobacteriaceae bacterium]|jgi:hypothetical protein
MNIERLSYLGCFVLFFACENTKRADWRSLPITEKEIYEVVNFAIKDQRMNRSFYLDLHPVSYGSNIDLNDFVRKETDSLLRKSAIPKVFSYEDLSYMLYQIDSWRDFVWDNYKLKFEQKESKLRYHISLPLFSKDRNTAIIFTETSGEILGTLTTIILSRNGTKWIKRASQEIPYRAYLAPYGIEALRRNSSYCN